MILKDTKRAALQESGPVELFRRWVRLDRWSTQDFSKLRAALANDLQSCSDTFLQHISNH